MDMDVVGNKERLLKGILDGETTTDIEPVGHEEILLKALLEKLGGGGGGIKTYDLEQYDSHWCEITIQSREEDPFVSPNLFRVQDHNDSAIVISVEPDIGSSSLSLVSNGRHVARVRWFVSWTSGGYPRQYRCRDDEGNYINLFDSSVIDKPLYIEEPAVSANTNYMILTQDAFHSGYVWMDGTEWANLAGIKPKSVDIINFSQQATAINQILTAIKQIASSSKGTTVNKYYLLDETTAEVVSELIAQAAASVFNKQRAVAITFNNEVGLVSESAFNYFSFHYSEWDFTNNLQYDFKITFTPSKIYFQCTCHEATSLM